MLIIGKVMCLNGLGARKDKLQTKLNKLNHCQENGTIPTVIFGGRINFMERMKGNLSNKEWKEMRTNELYSRGDKSKKGNLNIRLVYRNNTFYYPKVLEQSLLKISH